MLIKARHCVGGQGKQVENWKDEIIYYNNIPELYLIWEKKDYLNQITVELIKKIENIEFDFMLTVESKGIIFASPIANYFRKPIVIIQKKWNLPESIKKIEKDITNWRNEEETLYLNLTNIKPKQRYIFLDDVIQTKSTIKSCIEIIKESGSEIIEIYCIANITTEKEFNGIKIHSLL